MDTAYYEIMEYVDIPNSCIILHKYDNCIIFLTLTVVVFGIDAQQQPGSKCFEK